MFQFGRYDPDEEDRKLSKKRALEKQQPAQRTSTTRKDGPNRVKSKKVKDKDSLIEEVERQQQQDDSTPKVQHDIQPVFRVIAPEAAAATSSKRKQRNAKLHEEAFDDLGLQGEIDDIIPEVEDIDDGKGTTRLENDKKVMDPTDEIQRALHMSQLPIEEAARRWGLAPFLVSNLLEAGHSHFFPIQALVIPDVIIAEKYSMRARDVCVAAPTGSGKTLAFVLPVLNALATRKVRRLRALVVLPSRDLAMQVHEVFERYAKGSDLKVGLSIGQSDFRREQQQLLLSDLDTNGSDGHSSFERLAHLKHSLDPGNFALSLDAYCEKLECGGQHPTLPLGGISGVDVLVCTPGRLVDHCDNTPGFTLQHLRFLVIDEADRLLSQSYHGWIGRVFESTQSAARSVTMNKERNTSDIVVDPITWRLPDGAISAITMGGGPANSLCRPVQLRKLLYSATLTKDPQKLAALKLVNPKHFNAHHLTDEGHHSSTALYSMPELLKEYTVECTAGQKPLVLLSLLFERLQNKQKDSADKNQKSIIVVFTSSLDSTHRLARLLQLLWRASATNHSEAPIEFSSSLNQHQRSTLMKRCNDPNDPVSVVVCSDGMSRGMDIGFVSAVINYDVPGFAKTYVHRCGRTARAGKSGEAISLLKGTGQSGQFQKLRGLIDHPQKVSPYNVKTALVKDSIGLYQRCVARLKDLLAAEEQGLLRPMDTNVDEFIPQ